MISILYARNLKPKCKLFKKIYSRWKKISTKP